MIALIGIYLVSVLFASGIWLGYAAYEWPSETETKEDKAKAAAILRSYPMVFIWPVVLFGFITKTLREGDSDA